VNASTKIDQIEAKVEDTTERVKEQFDLKKQIEDRPLVALGAAFFGGLLLGGVMDGDDQQEAHRDEELRRPSAGSQPKSGGIKQSIRNAAKSSGLDETLSNLTAAAMGMMTEKVKSAADRNLPGFAEKFQGAQQAGGDFSAKTRAAQESGDSTPSQPSAGLRTND